MRSRTRILIKWVISPANRKMFMVAEIKRCRLEPYVSHKERGEMGQRLRGVKGASIRVNGEGNMVTWQLETAVTRTTVSNLGL